MGHEKLNRRGLLQALTAVMPAMGVGLSKWFGTPKPKSEYRVWIRSVSIYADRGDSAVDFKIDPNKMSQSERDELAEFIRNGKWSDASPEFDKFIRKVTAC